MPTLIGLLGVVVILLIVVAIRNRPRPGQGIPFSDLSPTPGFQHIRTVSTEVYRMREQTRGDSSWRRVIRLACHPNDAVSLIREPESPWDRNAIQVRRLVVAQPGRPRLGEQLGYLAPELAQELAPQIDRGALTLAQITEINSDRGDGKPAVHIQINLYRSPVGQPLGGPPRSGHNIFSSEMDLRFKTRKKI